MILSAQNQNKVSQNNLNNIKIAHAKNSFRKASGSKSKGIENDPKKVIFTKKSDQEDDNGLAKAKGLINGNGFSDGNGLTINLFSNYKYESYQTKRGQRLNQIKTIAQSHLLPEACDSLIEMANEIDGQDNVTVQIIKIVKKN